VSPSPISGTLPAAVQQFRKLSSISAKEIKPASGNPSRDATTANPLMNVTLKPEPATSLAERASWHPSMININGVAAGPAVLHDRIQPGPNDRDGFVIGRRGIVGTPANNRHNSGTRPRAPRIYEFAMHMSELEHILRDSHLDRSGFKVPRFAQSAGHA
jgi:hypothetical protein